MLKPYSKYKPTYIEWIGNIPEHWELKKIKHITKNLDGKRIPLSSEERGSRKGNFPYYGANGIIDYIDDFIFEGTNILVGEDGAPFFIPNRNVAFIAKGKYWVNNHAHILKPCEGILPEILAHLLNCVDYKEYITGSTRDKLTQSELSDIKIPTAPSSEQTAISNYLDKKTALIDSLIADKQKLIELFKEERIAVINEAVNGEGKGWERKKLKYVAKVVLGKMLTNEDKGGFVLKPYLRAANMQWLTVDVSDVKQMWFSLWELEKLRIKKNDLLVSEGGEVGRTCIWQDELDECYIQNSVHKITFYQNSNPFFFLYQFLYLGYIGFFESIVNRISIGHLTAEKLIDISVYFPTFNEQNAIVKHIQTEIKRIDETISDIEIEIELLQEYRTAMISEVVTGKIDVRDFETSKN